MAALRLLEALAPAAQLRIRADGDRTGWSIVEGLLDRFLDAERWRMPDGFTGFEEEVLDALLDDLSGSRAKPDDISRTAGGGRASAAGRV